MNIFRWLAVFVNRRMANDLNDERLYSTPKTKSYLPLQKPRFFPLWFKTVNLLDGSLDWNCTKSLFASA